MKFEPTNQFCVSRLCGVIMNFMASVTVWQMFIDIYLLHIAHLSISLRPCSFLGTTPGMDDSYRKVSRQVSPYPSLACCNPFISSLVLPTIFYFDIFCSPAYHYTPILNNQTISIISPEIFPCDTSPHVFSSFWYCTSLHLITVHILIPSHPLTLQAPLI